MVGRTISHFKITAKLGEGGMGAVYRAKDLKLGREVAIKVLPDSVAHDLERLARFEREAKLLASLNHANIAGIHQLARDGEVHFLVMELVHGRTLGALINAGPLPVEGGLQIARQIAEALEEAHERGVVHRDLKPGNVMVAGGRRVKVLDFGLAKAWSPEGPQDASESAALTQGLTRHGTVLGTAAYMSPEQTRGMPVDKRADIWAFGCVLYEMLTGRRAFGGKTASDTMVAVLQQEPSFDALPSETPPRIAELLERCLRKEARDRLRDIGDARIEIEEALVRGAIGESVLDKPEEVPEPPAIASETEPPAAAARGRRGLLVASVAAASLIAVLLLAKPVWQLFAGDDLVYLIDTSAPLGVYDEQTRTVGGTNADDLSDLLGDLPITLVKETTSPFWRREHQVLLQEPALVIVHLSAFAHQPGIENWEELQGARSELERTGLEDPMELGRSRLIALLGYLGLGSPRTRFIVYSRGTFSEKARADAWLADVETRFPELAGRVNVFHLVGDPGAATFRDPDTGAAIRRLVESTLDLE